MKSYGVVRQLQNFLAGRPSEMDVSLRISRLHGRGVSPQSIPAVSQNMIGVRLDNKILGVSTSSCVVWG